MLCARLVRSRPPGQWIAEAVMKMSFGNDIGFASVADAVLTGPAYGMIIAELTEECDCATLIGHTTTEPVITYDGTIISYLPVSWMMPDIFSEAMHLPPNTVCSMCIAVTVSATS